MDPNCASIGRDGDTQSNLLGHAVFGSNGPTLGHGGSKYAHDHHTNTVHSG